VKSVESALIFQNLKAVSRVATAAVTKSAATATTAVRLPTAFISTVK
jgi:hypothetical protein